MIDHVTITVSDLEKSKVFYEKALVALGMNVNFGSAEESFWGFGTGEDPELEIAAGRVFLEQSNAEHLISPRTHIALRAKDQAAVRAFYDAALAAGGRDNGAPGLRPNYSPTYYAAFVLDPDGNNIEAVTFAAEN